MMTIMMMVAVSCWNLQKNRVLSLTLFLSRQIPSALRLCSSFTTLDLSCNSLSGPIPSQLCSWLPYLVNLDFSTNSLSVPIPPLLSNCKFLNSLILSDNQLSGSIPFSLSSLNQLKKLDLSSNQLSGPIPSALAVFDSSSFANNPFLCENPVSSDCGGKSMSKISLIIIIVVGIFGAAASLIVIYFILRCCYLPKNEGGAASPEQEEDEKGEILGGREGVGHGGGKGSEEEKGVI